MTDLAPVIDMVDGHERDRFAHYVPKRLLTDAIILGTPVRALCGKIWVPSRDPEKYPVCPDCQRIRQQANGDLS